MSGTPQRSKVREKRATIVESQRKPNDMPCSHSFPPGPSRVLWMTEKRNMEEIGDKYERSGKCTDGTRLSDISPQKKLFQGYWRCLGPSKNQRWAAATMLQVPN